MNKNQSTTIVVFVVVALLVLYLIFRPHTSQPPVSIGSVTTASYACNAGKTITATYYDGASTPATSAGMPPTPGGSVALVLSDGRTMTLKQTISADGTRYANADESFVFWSKGNGALVLENNQEKSYVGCILVVPQPTDTTLSQIYSNSEAGFSLRYPSGYTIDDKYKYQALGPNKDIFGIKFTVPSSLATGTNLSTDSYISVEQIPQTAICSASLFVGSGATTKSVTDNDTTYSVATTSDAAAGNRYEETVYAISGTNPCVAVRYFIHYGVFENYPAGTIREFDKTAILNQFDQIRKTLTVVQ